MICGRILVTGANGFLGRAILTQLQMSSVPVYGTDIGAVSSLPGVAYQKADITRPEELITVLKNINVVIHTAGLAHVFSPDSNSFDKFRQVNEVGTVNIASTASAMGVEHLILISSVSVYGPCTRGIYDEDTPCEPVGPYALSKYNAELRAIEVARKSNMALTILRLATLYGEEDPGNVGRLMRLLDSGHFIWIGDGRNRKSLLYRNDAACASVAVAKRPASGINIYNVSAPPCTMRDIVDGFADFLGKHLLPVQVPASLAMFLSRQLSRIPDRRLADIHQKVKKWLAEDIYDVRRFEKAYNFHPLISLKDGLKREVEWYRRNSKR